MIRIRLRDEIFITKSIDAYPFCREIVLRTKDYEYTVTIKDTARVNALLSQACELGYIDFSKEDVVDIAVA